MFHFTGTVGIAIAVFHTRLGCKRKRFVKCGLADFGNRNRGESLTNSHFHPEGVENVGFVSILVNVSIAVHFPVITNDFHQGNRVVVVVQVARHSEGKLFHGVDARNGTRLRFRGVQRGEEKAGKDRYDCNDDYDNLLNIQYGVY